MKKKLLAFLLALTMVLAMAPMAFAAEEKPVFTPAAYTTGTVKLEELNPGDTVAFDVTLESEIVGADAKVYNVYDTMAGYACNVAADLDCAAQEEFLAYWETELGKADLVVLRNYIQVVPDEDNDEDDPEYYIVFAPMYYTDDAHYGVWVAGTEINADNASDVPVGMFNSGKVSYNAATCTLTLDNARISTVNTQAIFSLIPELTIQLVGNNVLTLTQTIADVNICPSVIAVMLGDLTITGSGSLTTVFMPSEILKRQDAEFQTNAVISLWAGYKFDPVNRYSAYRGDLTVDGTTLTVQAPNRVLQRFDAFGNPVDNDDAYRYSWQLWVAGVWADGVLLRDSDVDVTAAYEGIYAYDGFVIDHSTVTADTDGDSLYVEINDMIIRDSFVDVYAYEYNPVCVDYCDLLIENSVVNTENGNGWYAAIYDYGSATIRSSQVTAKGWCGFSGISLTVEGTDSVVQLTGLSEGEGNGAYLWQAGDLMPSLNITDGLAQFTGDGTAVWFWTEEDVPVEFSPEGSVYGSTQFNDFGTLTDGVSLKTYSELYGPDEGDEENDGYYSLLSIDGKAIKSVQFGDQCFGTGKSALSEGELNLTLNGRDQGKFFFRQVEGGWTIARKAETQGIPDTYLTAEDGKLVYSTEPFVWNYSDGSGFYTVKRTPASGFWFLFWYIPIGRSTSTTYYLTANTSGLTLGTRAASTGFAGAIASACHTPAYCRDLKNGTHQLCCSACGQYATVGCHYDETTHRCACGAYDPGVHDVTVEVASKGWQTLYGWFWIPYKVYTVNLTATGSDTAVRRIEYSTDGESWMTGTAVTSGSKLSRFGIRVTDASGAIHYYLYDCGYIFGNPVTSGDTDLLTGAASEGLKLPAAEGRVVPFLMK